MNINSKRSSRLVAAFAAGLCSIVVCVSGVEAQDSVNYKLTHIGHDFSDTNLSIATGIFLPGAIGGEVSFNTYALPGLYLEGQAGFSGHGFSTLIGVDYDAVGLLSNSIFLRAKGGIGNQTHRFEQEGVELERVSTGTGYDKVTTLTGLFPGLRSWALYGLLEGRTLAIEGGGELGEPTPIENGFTVSAGGGVRIENAWDFIVDVEGYGENPQQGRVAVEFEVHYGFNSLLQGLGATVRLEWDFVTWLGLTTEMGWVFLGNPQGVDFINGSFRSSVFLSVPIGINIASSHPPVDLECANRQNSIEGCTR